MLDSLAFNNETLLYNNLYELHYSDDPYNPLNLPANTVRVRTSDGNVPYKTVTTSYGTATLVPGTTDVYDVYKSGTNFDYLFYYSRNIVEVLGANTTGITSMKSMFHGCYITSVPLFDTSSVTDISAMFVACEYLTSVPLFNTSNATNMEEMFYNCWALTTVPLFDTSSVTNMTYVFYNCKSLTSIPLFNTSNVTNMTYTFYNCYKVQSGALALYQQASTQATPPSIHTSTFTDCGRDTVTGAAELAQIPADWK